MSMCISICCQNDRAQGQLSRDFSAQPAPPGTATKQPPAGPSPQGHLLPPSLLPVLEGDSENAQVRSAPAPR